VNKQQTSIWLQTLFPSLSLFTSLGTLVCCTLPVLLVTLGMGASLVSLIGFFPWITLISEFKLTIFAVSGSLISLALFFQWRTKYLPCPADPKKAKLCQNLRKISWILLYISLVFYSVGFFFSFIAIKIFY
tara:strand:+ start:882 stop:1274 length:393 start_codon:yes stop_codon:yes gene_type:complete